MPADALVVPAWMSLLIGLVLFFTRKWINDVARAIETMEARLRALEKAQTDCRLEQAREGVRRNDLERVDARLDNHATRITILEERDLAA